MNFIELEKFMSTRGISSLAEIARTLNTTPQAVSNWKSRDQVPHRIVAKLNQSLSSITERNQRTDQLPILSSLVNSYSPAKILEKDTISLSDILLIMAEQLKVIILVPFVMVFLTFTNVQFIQKPQYVSKATVLLPSSGSGNLGGLAGLASQFGVNVPAGVSADLSSPSLFPELLRSRTFAEKILDKKFYTEEFGKELSLLAILTHGNDLPKGDRNTLVTSALGSLAKMLEFNLDPSGSFSVIKATTNEPIFAKELTEVALAELENLNRFYKSQNVNEKTIFISNRIASVENDLKLSETKLKEFNERNRQISSPALQLEQGRFAREVEIQTGVYLTLKQQLELAKIEEVQETSIVQILDNPQLPLNPSNKNLIQSVMLAGILGIGLGIIIGFGRVYIHTSDMGERKKLRRVKHLFNKKVKDVLLDRRMSGIISGLMLSGLPLFLGYKSKFPVFFGRYSAKFLALNIVYILVLIFSLGLFIHLSRNSRKKI